LGSESEIAGAVAASDAASMLSSTAPAIYSETGNPVISGDLKSIDMDSFDGTWNIVLAVSSSTGASYTVTEAFGYESSFFAEAACQQGSQAFQPAVQDLIKKVVSHADFPKLIAAG
jgi:hypothetical protein